MRNKTYPMKSFAMMKANGFVGLIDVQGKIAVTETERTIKHGIRAVVAEGEGGGDDEKEERACLNVFVDDVGRRRRS